jgi:hypothetical protein
MRKEKEMDYMIWIIWYVVTGLVFGLIAVNRFIKLTGFNWKHTWIIGLGLIIWVAGWPIFESIKVYKRELA